MVAVDVRITVRTALEAIVASSADAVVEAVIFGRANGVIADNVAAARVDEADALRPGWMSALPIVRSASRIFDQIALNHQMSGVGLGVHRAVGTGRNTPHASAADTAPAGNVAVLDNDIDRKSVVQGKGVNS